MASAQGPAAAQEGENSIGHAGEEKRNEVLNWRRGQR